MWTNQRAAVRIWEFLFPPLLLENYVSLATFRKVFLYLSLCGENVSGTIDLCGILTFWRSWIPFYSCTEVKFRVLEEPGKNAGVQLAANSPKKKKKSPFTIPEPSSSRSLWKGTRNDEVSNISGLQSWHVFGHLHINVSKNYLLEARPRISSFHPNWRSYRDFTEKGLSDFPKLSIYVTTTTSLNGQLSTRCHCWLWAFRVKQINWKEDAGRKEEESLIVAELMCFCLFWIVSSSPL